MSSRATVSGTTHRLAFGAALVCTGVVAGAAEAPTAQTRATVSPARVLEVASFSDRSGDYVVFAGGTAAGWREGMRAQVLRGNLSLAELTVVHSGSRASAALIDSLAPELRIGAGDTVSVKLQQISN